MTSPGSSTPIRRLSRGSRSTATAKSRDVQPVTVREVTHTLYNYAHIFFTFLHSVSLFLCQTQQLRPQIPWSTSPASTLLPLLSLQPSPPRSQLLSRPIPWLRRSLSCLLLPYVWAAPIMEVRTAARAISRSIRPPLHSLSLMTSCCPLVGNPHCTLFNFFLSIWLMSVLKENLHSCKSNLPLYSFVAIFPLPSFRTKWPSHNSEQPIKTQVDWHVQSVDVFAGASLATKFSFDQGIWLWVCYKRGCIIVRLPLLLRHKVWACLAA